MSNERLVIGPPGCGKTTFVARQTRNAVASRGKSSVLICSLTKAAAKEAAGRDTGIDENNVGTLHSHCYRALRLPKVVDGKSLEDWNTSYPQYALTRDGADEEGYSLVPGDKIMQRVDLFRSRMVDIELWPIEERNFYSRWQEWKTSNNLCDFTDMIERALTDLPFAPSSPEVLITDEGQDHSRLEISVLRKWSQFCEWVLIVGDPDQALYHWRGADPEILNRPGLRQGEMKHSKDGDTYRDLLDEAGSVVGSVRSQSYRVPRAVHRAAVNLIERVPGRVKIDYEPTDVEGEVVWSGVGSNRFDYYLNVVMESIEERLAMKREDRPRHPAVMILTSCEFMLRPIIKNLRVNGIPYFNPYTDRWNPLRPSKGISMREKLLSFLKPQAAYFGDNAKFWTVEDLRRFALSLRSVGTNGGVLARGAKKRLEGITEDIPEVEVAWLVREIFTQEALPHLSSGDLHWFVRNLLAKDQEAVKFPIEIINHFGVTALEDSPTVCVGTIHSVKGGEADTVIVFPDLSPAGYQMYRTPGWSGYDSMLRLYYVAMTRSRKRLILGSPSTGMYASVV